jgi:carboxyl-terminal processing protease
VVRKTRAGTTFLILTVVLFAASALTIRPAEAFQTVTQARIYRDFQAAMNVVRESYVEELPYEALTKGGIQGMLRVLDPHSGYFDKKAFAELSSEQRSHYFGIGAQIAPRNRGTYVLETFSDTPAYRAGLRYGDHIVSVDGKDTSTWLSDRVRNVLRGERGTTVNVTVRRPGVAQPITVAIRRDSVSLPSITSYYLLRPGIGYVNLSRGFHSTTSDELTRAMADLTEKGAKSFVLDLRENRGGYLDQAIKVVDKFLARGQVVVSVRGREGKNFDRDIVAESGATENFPLVILIDRESASASEIVAGAIQDHDRGLIVGESSFGKGLVQHIFPLKDGSGLTLTIARYYTPSGRLIQRDYSNGSLFEYYSRRDNPQSADTQTKPQGEEKRTDLGRAVYGGGGIEPDIKVPSSEIFTPAQGRLYHGLFMFARELTAGRIAGLEKYKIDGITFQPGPKANAYWIGDDVLAAYRNFMTKFLADNPDYGLTPAAVEAELVWARKQLRQEVLWSAYGYDEMKRLANDLDIQLQRAIAELPNSAELSQKSWRK